MPLRAKPIKPINQVKVTTSTKSAYCERAGICPQRMVPRDSAPRLIRTSITMTLTMVNAREILEKMNKGQGTVGKLINDDALFQTAQSTLKKADRALDGMSDSGPITAVGIVANSLF